jgi:hypothetical protein
MKTSAMGVDDFRTHTAHHPSAYGSEKEVVRSKNSVCLKGKTEAGVKYVRHNAVADQVFASFGALEQHLAEWITIADQRCEPRRDRGRAS